MKPHEYSKHRTKEEGEKLIGHDCSRCEEWYRVMQIPELADKSSRHRSDRPRVKTPDKFYDLDC